MFRAKNIVFVLVIFSTFIAWSAEVLGIYWLNSIPDILTIVIFFVLFLTGKISLPVRIVYSIIPIIIVFSIVIFYNLLHLRNLTGGSGIVGLTMLTILFAIILNSDKSSGQVYSLGKQISILYVIHITYIFLETILVMKTDYAFMKSLIPTYRNLTGQPIYQLLNMRAPGANGLMVGPQVASQMLALSIIWFAPIYRNKLFTLKYLPNNLIWVVSLILFPFCMTGTSLVMFFVMIMSILFIYPKSLINVGFYSSKPFIIIIILVGIFTGTILDVLTYRAGTSELVTFYLKVFLDPVFAFVALPLENLLFGLQDDYSLLKYTDFGLGAVLWKGGALLAFISIMTFIAILSRVFFVLRKNKLIESSWLAMAAASAVGAIGWFVSLGHYTVATETGGKQFFALLMATMVLSLIRLRFRIGKKQIISHCQHREPYNKNGSYLI